jgi:hypothetical protein
VCRSGCSARPWPARWSTATPPSRSALGCRWRAATTRPGVTGLACLDGWLYAATANGGLHHLPAAKLGDAPQWTPLPDRLELRGLTAASGLLIGLGADGEVYWRRPVAGAAPWVRLCAAPEGAVALAGGAGMLVASADRLRWRAATR